MPKIFMEDVIELEADPAVGNLVFRIQIEMRSGVRLWVVCPVESHRGLCYVISDKTE